MISEQTIKKLNELKELLSNGEDENDYIVEELTEILGEVTDVVRQLVVMARSLDEEVSLLSKDVNSLCDGQNVPPKDTLNTEGLSACSVEETLCDYGLEKPPRIHVKGDMIVTNNFYGD